MQHVCWWRRLRKNRASLHIGRVWRGHRGRRPAAFRRHVRVCAVPPPLSLFPNLSLPTCLSSGWFTACGLWYCYSPYTFRATTPRQVLQVRAAFRLLVGRWVNVSVSRFLKSCLVRVAWTRAAVRLQCWVCGAVVYCAKCPVFTRASHL